LHPLNSLAMTHWKLSCTLEQGFVLCRGPQPS
jgi:hypothetical protein